MTNQYQITRMLNGNGLYKEAATSNQVTGIKKNNAGTILAVTVLNYH